MNADYASAAVLGAVLGRRRVLECSRVRAGRVYPRAELHREWNGETELQRQGGILTPCEVPLIVVVTGEEGHEYG